MEISQKMIRVVLNVSPQRKKIFQRANSLKNNDEKRIVCIFTKVQQIYRFLEFYLTKSCLKHINLESYNNSIHIHSKMIHPLGSQFSSFHTIQFVPVSICFNSVPLNFINFYSEYPLFQQNDSNAQKNSSKQQINIQIHHQNQSLDSKHKKLVSTNEKQESRRDEILTEKKQRETEQQYKPSQPKKQKKLKNKVYQSVRRNILPNIVHQIFCFIQKKKRSESIVRKYVEKMSSQQTKYFNVDRFYLYQRLIKEKRNHYINMEGLSELNEFQEPECQIYSKSEQKTFIKMNRILMKYFLEHQFLNVALTSSRMSSQARLWNLEEKRKIMSFIINNFQHSE